MHQDGSYADYLVPAEMITCWVALDDTHAQGGTIEYVRGSHRWPKVPPDRGSFHAPDDWLAPMRKAAPDGVEPERVPVVVKAGGCTFHHSLTFHGSGPNEATVERRALVSHLVPVETRFHPTNTDVTYSRYRRRGDLSLDESFFPVLWDEEGGRSAWLSGLPALP
jgi:ectoine hydroxylase-related dioxygenase (phytanoyl-CoA dioxygenase family)